MGVKMEGDIGTIGITNHAQEQLGDVVFVDLPETGLKIDKDDTMGAVESVKAASDIYAPVSGEVVEVNTNLTDDPALVNSAAEGDGWTSRYQAATRRRYYRSKRPPRMVCLLQQRCSRPWRTWRPGSRERVGNFRSGFQ